MLLDEVVNGRRFEASHLCHNRRCVTPSHIVVEDSVVNTSRQKCHTPSNIDVVITDENGEEVWDLSKWECQHLPKCLPAVRLVDLREHELCLDKTEILDFDDVTNIL